MRQPAVPAQSGASLALLEQAIATAQVEPPSTRLGAEAGSERGTTQGKLARRLKGDLDAIVLKALAKAPADRYASATALADDLQRYLYGEPVEARPNRITYRLVKFVLRHRSGMATGAGVAVLMAASAGYVLTHRPPLPSPDTAKASITSAVTSSSILDDKSIAVLPFVDMSEKHDQEYFSDGLSEELIDRLSHSPDLRVISRTSSFYFKGKQATIGEIGKTLNVGHVLEGSVRKSGRALRITAQLIRASDGSHLWSQSYDRSLPDVFKVQGEIAAKVAQALKVALSSVGDATGSKDSSPEAYNLLLQGNFFFDRRTKPDSYRAIEFYKRTIELDPNYPLAWAKLARVYEMQAGYAWGSILEGEAKARDAAERALKLNPNLAMAHQVLGRLSMQLDWDWKVAREKLERARELEPDSLDVADDLAWVNAGMYGWLDETIEILRKRISRDPLDTPALNRLAVRLFFSRRYEEALAESQQVVLLNPSHAGAHAFLGYELLYLGRLDEALAAALAEPDEPWRLMTLPIVYWAMGRKTESDASLRELEAKYPAEGSYNIAAMHAYRGEIDAAFKWLDRAYRQHDGGMTLVRVDPLLQNLRRDPRYQALLVKMKLNDDGPSHRA